MTSENGYYWLGIAGKGKGSATSYGRGEQVKTIAALIAATVAALVLGTGTAKADCQTQCYDSGNTGEHCVTTCN